MIIDATYTARFMTMKHLIPLLLETTDGAQAVIDVSSLGSHLTLGAPIGYSVAALADNRLHEPHDHDRKHEGPGIPFTALTPIPRPQGETESLILRLTQRVQSMSKRRRLYPQEQKGKKE